MDITPNEKRKFAKAVFNISDKEGVKNFTGLFFGLNDGKINSVEEFLSNYDSKKLYKIFI